MARCWKNPKFFGGKNSQSPPCPQRTSHNWLLPTTTQTPSRLPEETILPGSNRKQTCNKEISDKIHQKQHPVTILTAFTQWTHLTHPTRLLRHCPAWPTPLGEIQPKDEEQSSYWPQRPTESHFPSSKWDHRPHTVSHTEASGGRAKITWRVLGLMNRIRLTFVVIFRQTSNFTNLLSR